LELAGEYAASRAVSPDIKCCARKATRQVMSSYDIAEQIREFLPGTEEILVQYLSGYLVDEASEDEDILQVARYMLESVAMDKPDVLEHLMTALSALLQDQLTRREKAQSVPKLQRLDKVLDMSKAGAMSNTIAFSEGVDLESINKGKCVNDGYPLQSLYLMYYD
jgi:ATP-binding cassette subfamily F protein 3